MKTEDTIKTPDGMNYLVESQEQKVAFVAGFCSALHCFGIWKSGVQTIGCMETPVKDVIQKMKADNNIVVD